MKTIHLIASAHLDPIWLWPWHNGLDAVLNTCRTMVRFLERHPEVIFTCGEAWKYRQVQDLAPDLFQKIRTLVAAGRWEIVGGWWIQPDCNQPSGFALERQISLGQDYFRQNFGHSPQVAFNVDSFGHAATLPRYMHAAGQPYYVMMRPQEHEMTLPARLFHWQGEAGGPAVVTFRVAGGYGDFNRINEEHVRKSLTELPDGIDHTMCFVGVGDHGGGPNERLMQWLADHRDNFADVKLVWSSPSRFFAAVQNDLAKLPTHVGELQHHAVGCYSVERAVKQAVRTTEHLLAQAETVATPADRPALDEAWRTACFHHFHDTLGGTCIPSAYPQVHAQLGGVVAFADTLLHHALRRRTLAMPADPHHRLVLHNASDTPFAGYVSWEYWWGDGGPWQDHWRLLDETGRVVPHQMTRTEAVQVTMQSRLLFRVDLPAGETCVLRVDRDTAGPRDMPADAATADGQSVAAPGIHVNLAQATMTLAGRTAALPHLELIDDPTDTWSHGIDRFGGAATAAVWQAPVVLENGPVMAAILHVGYIGRSPVQAEYRVYRDAPFVELLLTVEWVERHKILKVVWPLPAPLQSHDDGIPGGVLPRPPDGVERPVRDFTLLHLADGHRLSVVMPEVYALDATPDRVRLTLLRSPLMAHHDPAAAAVAPQARFSDRGLHTFRFRFFAGEDVTTAQLNVEAMVMQRPLVVAETTDRMPAV